MYKTIQNAISFALEEVRHAQHEVSSLSGNEEISFDAYKMLRRVAQKLNEAQDELNPF